MKYLQVIAGILVGAFFGALIEGMEGRTKMITVIIFGGLATICFILMGLIRLSKKLWPNREKWLANSSYPSELLLNNPQIALNKNRGEQWRSTDAQEVDEWFEVDMGKERMISRIEFIPDYSDIEKPKKWRMMSYGEDDNKQKQTLSHNDGEYNISIQSRNIPNRIRWFRVEIKEVAEDMPVNSNYFKRNCTTKVHWTISLVKIWEYRFSIFGRRFCEHEL